MRRDTRLRTEATEEKVVEETAAEATEAATEA